MTCSTDLSSSRGTSPSLHSLPFLLTLELTLDPLRALFQRTFIVVLILSFDDTPFVKLTDSSLFRPSQHDGIVNNGVLRVLTRTYGLEKRLLASVYEGQALSRNKSIQSDLFEAYISGVQMQLGEEAAQAWVRAIIEPMIHLAYQDRKERSEREEAKKKERKKEKKEKGLLDPTNGGVPGLSSLESSPGVLSLQPSPMGRPLEEMEAIVYPKNPCVPVFLRRGVRQKLTRCNLKTFSQSFRGADVGPRRGQGYQLHPNRDQHERRTDLPRRRADCHRQGRAQGGLALGQEQVRPQSLHLLLSSFTD